MVNRVMASPAKITAEYTAVTKNLVSTLITYISMPERFKKYGTNRKVKYKAILKAKYLVEDTMLRLGSKNM
jgi:hypothetical protein